MKQKLVDTKCQRLHRRYSETPLPRLYKIKRQDIKVVKNQKGRGLVACIDLNPNASIIYTGRFIVHQEYDEMVANGDDVCHIMQTGNKSKPYVDGRGHLPSLINEPSPGERANVVIRFSRTSRLPWPRLVVTEHIPKGKEILLHYGNCFKRRGYRAGRRAIIKKCIR